MESFFDTSVLIAAFVGTDPRHTASFNALECAEKDQSACAAHTLAEVYSVLTRLPLKPPISARRAADYIAVIGERLTIIPLATSEYSATIEAMAKRGIAGGRIYDALLLRGAEMCDPNVIYTWNVKHFQAIAPDLADRIRTP